MALKSKFSYSKVRILQPESKELKASFNTLSEIELKSVGKNYINERGSFNELLNKESQRHFEEEQDKNDPYKKPFVFQGNELFKKHAARGVFKCINPNCASCNVGFKKITAP